jgi:hypothetical protein
MVGRFLSSEKMLGLLRRNSNIKDGTLMMWVFNILFIVYLFFISRNFFVRTELVKWYYPLFLLKLLYGLAYAFLYSHYYSDMGDSSCYHHEGMVLNDYFWDHPLQYIKLLVFNELQSPKQAEMFCTWGLDRAFFMSKFISILYIVLSKNYWVITIYCASINFMATYYFANILVKRYPAVRFAAVIAFLAWPSIQIWTSGLLKESFATAALLVLLGLYLEGSGKRYLKLLAALLCICFLYKCKPYYLVVLPFVGIHYLYENHGKTIAFLLSLLGLVCLLYLGIMKQQMIFDYVLYSSDVSYYTSLRAASNNQVGALTANIWTLVKHFHLIVFKACFEPTKISSAYFLPAIEGLFNLLVLASAIMTLTGLLLYRYKITKDFLLVLGFIVAGALIVGLTVPNYGAMVRIRVFYEPFVVFLSVLGPCSWLENFLSYDKEGNKSCV